MAPHRGPTPSPDRCPTCGMAAVRQTQTVVQTQSGGQLLHPHPLDNSLDALLEDLQTSVSRGRSAMNGPSGGHQQHQEYREIRQVRQQVSGSPQVQYLSPANPTTVVAEREPSPLLQPAAGEQRSVAYKTVSYQYSASDGQPGHALSSSAGSPSDQTPDVRLRENLNELDSLLVDLHQAQKAGFGTPQGTASTTVNRVEVSRTGVDPGLLEPLDTSTPAPPTRQQQHVSRSVQYRQYSSARSASADTSVGNAPQLQPRRSTSAQRELTYEPSPPARSTRTRSPSPVATSVTRREVYYETDGSARYRDKSPSNRRLQKEVYYETKDSTPYPTTVRHEVYYDAEPGVGVPPPSSTSRHEVYYETEKSSTLPPPRQDVYYEHKTSTLPPQRQDVYYDTKTSTLPPVRHDVYYETKTSSTLPPQRQEVYYETRNVSKVVPSPRPDRYREPSPPPHRLQTSPPADTTDKPDRYAPQPNSAPTTVTAYRTYNYSSSSSSATQPPHMSGPVPDSRPAYPDTSPLIPSHYPQSPPTQHSSPPTQTVIYRDGPDQPPTKVTTTVRTYTYELPGEPGVLHTHPYPPGPDHPYPDQQPHKPNVEHTVTYHVSPHHQPEKEPLLPTQHQPLVIPAEPNPPPTVITYKYSSHSSHNTTNKYPPHPHPEEQQPLLPRPFPTSSPGPDYPPNGQPPKRLDDLMASFSDTEADISPHPKHYNVEKQMTASPAHPPGGPADTNAVAVVTPTQQNVKVEETKAKTEIKARERTVNKPGPPVFYPPGVELFSKKEESMAMASGRRAKGKYKYEAESYSKSKSSSSGGAAVVPVCLPLCCAMPCVIM
ncbi:leucine-rich repeat extensin-like protein 5 isoform X1 [Schistocerca americana]|uniref:leucine-rich repeat extensin-like protein 5 isoform X1 n=2 Tax=Schistocerca americana TaxID=7009 RepID=UPI001F4FF217|nr:leucine-rich repeat extensin-like protein 5 isoform X1 [Schistocerca americana]